MPVIPGTTVAWPLSPRIVTIPATETSITVADLQDTLQDLEDDVDGIVWQQTRQTSGGESLGGGVTVGLTMELQNTQIAFAPRTTSISNGTATSADVTGSVLTDTSATFITDGVEPGATIINFTDQSVTSVISVDSETQITHYALGDGIDNEWAVSDIYKIWNETQCEIAGGNTVAVDDLDAEISAIRPTFGTQVLKTSSSSATLQELQDIQYASFNGGVSVDVLSPYSGTEYPVGTPRQPVNNFTDALAISTLRGFNTLFIFGDALVDSGSDLTDFTLVGQGVNLSTFTLASASTFVDTTFTQATVTGVLDGDAHIYDCIIEGLTFVSGVIDSCILNPSPIVLGGNNTAHFINCASGVPGLGTPIIDMGGSGQPLALRNYNGGVKIINKDGNDPVSIDMSSGHVILDSTVTNGLILVRGVGALTDNSIGANVNSENLINKALLTDITDLVSEVKFQQPSKQDISKAVWSTELIEFEDEEESAGGLLFSTAEVVEDRVASKEEIAQAVWSKELTEAFGPDSAGGIMKKIKLVYKILVS